jgi:hypothetical protein
MPSLNNKALLFEISAFIADNNIRRSVLTVATNTMATDGVVMDRSMIVQPNDTPAKIECIANNKATIIKCTGGPVMVTVTVGTNFTPVQFEIASVWIMTTAISNLSVFNSGSRAVQLRFIQV